MGSLVGFESRFGTPPHGRRAQGSASSGPSRSKPTRLPARPSPGSPCPWHGSLATIRGRVERSPAPELRPVFQGAEEARRSYSLRRKRRCFSFSPRSSTKLDRPIGTGSRQIDSRRSAVGFGEDSPRNHPDSTRRSPPPATLGALTMGPSGRTKCISSEAAESPRESRMAVPAPRTDTARAADPTPPSSAAQVRSPGPSISVR